MPVRITLRLYEELNDYLPAEQRKISLEQTVGDDASVRTVLGALGVPEQQVDLVLVNGKSENLDHHLRDGDRLGIYPVFESFDVSELTRLQGRPLRQLRFVADTHLGKLAAYLRMLGFDTLYERDWRDAELAAISQRQQRVLLARDRLLLQHRGLTRAYGVAGEVPRAQLAETLHRFDLAASAQPFGRCLRCNAATEEAKKADVLSRVSSGIAARYERFWVCPGCDRIFWQNAHFRRIQHFVHQTLQATRTRPSPDL